MMATLKQLETEIIKLKKEVAKIKSIVLDEGELTDWAKKALKKARETPLSEYSTLKEVERELFG